MTCANVAVCGNDAVYRYDAPSVRTIDYCADCLPAFLTDSAKSGALDIPAAKAEALVAVQQVLSPKAEEKPSKGRKPKDWVDPAAVTSPEPSVDTPEAAAVPEPSGEQTPDDPPVE